jgi:hypothetical protein
VLVDHEREEVAEHLLRHVEVGDHAVLHGADGEDALGRAAEHALGLQPDALDLLRLAVDRHHRGLVQHDALALDVDQGVGGAEVDGDRVGGEERARPLEGPDHLCVRSGDASEEDARGTRPTRGRHTARGGTRPVT